MIEEMQMITQKQVEENQAANQKKIEEHLSAISFAQKTAQLHQTKMEERLAAMASEQNATQLRQQTSLLNDVKMLAPVKPDYSNLMCFNCGKIDHSAKQPKKPIPTVAERNCIHCHQPGHFRRNCPMIASISGDEAEPRSSTNACKKLEYTKTREAYIELVIAGRTCSCQLDTGSDVTLFPHTLVHGLPLDQYVVDLSAANGNSIPILGAVTVTARLQGKDIEIEGLVTDQAKGSDWNFRTEKLTVDGQVCQLMNGRTRAHCRRLVLQKHVTLPTRSQLDVQTMVVYPTYSSTRVDGEKAWISEAGEVAGKGVRTSRTLVPPRSKDVPLRMMNLRDVAVRLNKRATVAELQPVDVVDTVTPPTKEERQQQCISELMRRTDYSF